MILPGIGAPNSRELLLLIMIMEIDDTIENGGMRVRLAWNIVCTDILMCSSLLFSLPSPLSPLSPQIPQKNGGDILMNVDRECEVRVRAGNSIKLGKLGKSGKAENRVCVKWFHQTRLAETVTSNCEKWKVSAHDICSRGGTKHKQMYTKPVSGPIGGRHCFP